MLEWMGLGWCYGESKRWGKAAAWLLGARRIGGSGAVIAWTVAAASRTRANTAVA